MIKCSDLIKTILGYKYLTDARWYRNIRNNNKFIIEGETPSQLYFTE